MPHTGIPKGTEPGEANASPEPVAGHAGDAQAPGQAAWCDHSDAQASLCRRDGRWLTRFTAILPDRPGALADLARLTASYGLNLERLHYDRGRDPHRVELVTSSSGAAQAGAALDLLAGRGELSETPPGAPGAKPACAPGGAEEPLSIIDVTGVLSFKVALVNRPGALAALTGRFRDLSANIIHLRYDSDCDPEMAELSVATSGAGEASRLLSELTRTGYHYHVLWRGDESEGVSEVLGLSGVEAFLFRLRGVLPPGRMSMLEELFKASRTLRQALADFRGASGASSETLAASGVYAEILRLAASALGTTGEHFTMRLSGPVRLSPGVGLYMLTCPEGANSYLLRHEGGLALIDTNFGIYYEDVTAWLAAHGFDPSDVRQVLATHPDADHAGWAARLSREVGAGVFMHPEAARVFASEDRSLGRGSLAEINRSFTRMINRLSGLEAPGRYQPFEPVEPGRTEGGFPVMGRIRVADLEFLVLESLGGHAAAQVFFYEPARGALFCGDYLLDVPSLSPRDREQLSVHRALLTSTNTDSALFVREMAMLKDLMRQTEARLRPDGGRAMVFPGHGDFYAVEGAGW